MLTIEKMKEIKDMTGISYDEISVESGVPLSTVQKVLTQETQYPRSGTLARLRAYFEKFQEMEKSHKVSYTTADPEPLMLQEAVVPYGEKAKSDVPVIYEEWPHEQRTYKRYTIEDYYALPEDIRVELIDGEFYNMASPSRVHQRISIHIGYFLMDFVRKNNGSYEVYTAPLDVQLDRDIFTMLQPDVMIICKDENLTDRNIQGAPDLVMEILSPSNRKKDMILKRKKYFGAGVREYWIIDPMRETVEVIRESEDYVTRLYTFEDAIPVGIWNGRCVIDMKEVMA